MNSIKEILNEVVVELESRENKLRTKISILLERTYSGMIYETLEKVGYDVTDMFLNDKKAKVEEIDKALVNVEDPQAKIFIKNLLVLEGFMEEGIVTNAHELEINFRNMTNVKGKTLAAMLRKNHE